MKVDWLHTTFYPCFPDQFSQAAHHMIIFLQMGQNWGKHKRWWCWRRMFVSVTVSEILVAVK